MATLLAAGADLEATDDRGNMPLLGMLWGGTDTIVDDFASTSGFERMRFLLQAGADPSATKTEAEVEYLKARGCEACRTAFDFASRKWPEELSREPDLYNLLLEGHRKAMERIGN